MESATLRRDAVGFWRVVFQGVSSTAPAAIVSTITAASIYAYGSVPLSFLIAFAGVLTTIVAVYEYSKKVAHAGGYYSFVSQSAGPFLGILTGLMLLGYEITDLAFVPLFFSILATFSLQFFAGIVLPTWVSLLIVAMAVVFWSLPPFLGIKPSLGYSIIFGLAEIIVLLGVAITLSVMAGPQNTVSVFTPVFAPTGIHGALLGGVFAITSFLGYGSVVTLGEEAKFPKKTIGKALLVDVLLSGIFFIVVSYAFTIAWGPNNASTMSNYLVPLTVITKSQLGVVVAGIITFFFVESFFNSGLSFTNAAVRYFYGMARDGHVLPRSLAKVHEGSGVPRRALGVIVIAVLILSLTFGEAFGLLEGFVLLATVATVLSLLVHIIVNSTVWRLYKKSNEFKVVVHLVIPLIASALFAFIIYSTVYPPSFPLTYMPIAALVWILISIVMIFYVRWKKHEQYAEAGTHSIVE